MPLSIRNPEVDRLARELAAETGQSVTEALREALVHELDRLRADRGEAQRRKYAELAEIGRRCAALPTLDNRSEDEILGYDDHGIPSR